MSDDKCPVIELNEQRKVREWNEMINLTAKVMDCSVEKAAALLANASKDGEAKEYFSSISTKVRF